MKKLTFSLLFFSAIAWLWIGRMIAADGTLVNSAGTTTVGGSSTPGDYLTNNNVNVFVVYTNNRVSIAFDSVGRFIHTNYVASEKGNYFETNGVFYCGSGSIITPNGDLILTRVSTSSARFGNTISSFRGVGLGDPNNPTAKFNLISTGVELNNTSDGVYTNLTVRSLMMPTNYVAAAFTPVAGMVFIVPSNGVYYKVTQLSTNLLNSTTP